MTRAAPAAVCPACNRPMSDDVHSPLPGGADWPRYDHRQLLAAYENGRAQGAASERERIRQGAGRYWHDVKHERDGYVPGWFEAILLDGTL